MMSLAYPPISHDNDGGLAERRGSGLQSRRHRFESGTRLSVRADG